MGIKPEVYDQHLMYYPEEERLLKPFLPDFDITWGQRRRAHNTELSAYFLKPRPDTQEAFGFEQELLLVYSPFPDLQARSIKAAEQFLYEDRAKGRVERLAYLLISDMPTAREWVEDYVSRNQEARLIAVFSAAELEQYVKDRWFVWNQLAKQFFGRDLFDFRLPLEHDTYFFGREAEVLAYRDAIRRGENRGLFGLRKTGKTSLLFKVERVLKAENIADVIYIDCKSPTIRTLRWFELLARLSAKIGGTVEFAKIAEQSNAQTAEQFVLAVSRATTARRLVLIFDEIEYISPLAKLDPHWKQDFVSFWQTIWSCQSRHRGLAAILAGVNPTITEVSQYEGVQNPLFGIVSPQFLKGFAPDETQRMVRTLGRRMGLKFKQDAIDYLQSHYGGHPLLTRIACSLLNSALTRGECKRPVTIQADMLATDEAVRDSDISYYCEHVVSELREFYSDEYTMLEFLARKQMGDYLELARDTGMVKHLRNYGLLNEIQGSPSIAIPVVERYVASRAGGAYLVEPSQRIAWVAQRINSLIHDLRALERRIEFKKLPLLFGPNSYPEADRFARLTVVHTQADFDSFINVLNRCLVESVERYGEHQLRTRYFWELQKTYPSLLRALERVKIYRNDSMHLALTPQVEAKLAACLKEDLEGRKPSEVEDVWFILQQRILDGLFAAIQIESARLN